MRMIMMTTSLTGKLLVSIIIWTMASTSRTVTVGATCVDLCKLTIFDVINWRHKCERFVEFLFENGGLRAVIWCEKCGCVVMLNTDTLLFRWLGKFYVYLSLVSNSLFWKITFINGRLKNFSHQNLKSRAPSRVSDAILTSSKSNYNNS